MARLAHDTIVKGETCVIRAGRKGNTPLWCRCQVAPTGADDGAPEREPITWVPGDAIPGFE
jgi:hypothetical protein